MAQDSTPEFPDELNQHVTLSGSDEALFGRDVLSGLVAGVEAAAHRPTSSRRWGCALLGCAMWMDDPGLIDALKKLANVCVVVTKQRLQGHKGSGYEALNELAKSNGLAPAAYPELHDFAPGQDGEPLLVGPSDSWWHEESTIPAVREVGFRRVSGHLVPLVHAKIALLGHMSWTDEHPTGAVVDDNYFVADRLWIGSANFTRASRESLEMGVWTSNPQLMRAARRFLLTLVTLSEPLGSAPNVLAPEMAPVEFDDDAMRQCINALDPPPDSGDEF